MTDATEREMNNPYKFDKICTDRGKKIMHRNFGDVVYNLYVIFECHKDSEYANYWTPIKTASNFYFIKACAEGGLSARGFSLSNQISENVYYHSRNNNHWAMIVEFKVSDESRAEAVNLKKPFIMDVLERNLNR